MGQITGKIDRGIYVGPVKINSYIGRFSGNVTVNGDYYRGILISQSGDKFVGELNADGTYKSGTLYSNGTIFISNKYERNKPVGIYAIGNELGNYSLYDCTSASKGCIPINTGVDAGIQILTFIMKEIATDFIGSKLESLIYRVAPQLANFKILISPFSGFMVGLAIDVTIEMLKSESQSLR